MKKFLLAIVAALALSTGSTDAFRSTPQTAEEFRALDPESAHYKTSQMSDTTVVGGADGATQTMQPAQALSLCTNMTGSGLWQWGKWAISLPSYALNPFAYATSWTTSKMLTQIFKLPGIRNYLGEKTAAFAGSIMGLATIYAFNPFGFSTQTLTTLHVLLSISFSMDIFERLCSLAAAMLNHEWKIAGMELAASVIVGLLIFDAKIFGTNGIRTAISNGTANTVKQYALNPLLDKLSTSGYEWAHAVANSLYSVSGYETNLHNCLRTTGFDAGRCAKLIPQPPVDNSMALITVAQPTTPMHECPVQTERSRALTVTQPTEWHSEALQKSTDAAQNLANRIDHVKACVATTGKSSSQCAAEIFPSPVQTPGHWESAVRHMKNAWSWGKSLFSSTTKPTPAKPSTFVQDANQCMKNTGLDVNACVDMASTVNMQNNKCPAYTRTACNTPVPTVVNGQCPAVVAQPAVAIENPSVIGQLVAKCTQKMGLPTSQCASDPTALCMCDTNLKTCPEPTFTDPNGIAGTHDTICIPRNDLSGKHILKTCYKGYSSEPIHCCAANKAATTPAVKTAIENNPTQSVAMPTPAIKSTPMAQPAVVQTPVVEQTTTKAAITTAPKHVTPTAKHAAVVRHQNPVTFSESCTVPSATQSMVGLPDGEIDNVVKQAIVDNSQVLTVATAPANHSTVVAEQCPVVSMPQQTVTQPVAQQQVPTLQQVAQPQTKELSDFERIIKLNKRFNNA
jgi:hypothetical protein